MEVSCALWIPWLSYLLFFLLHGMPTYYKQIHALATSTMPGDLATFFGEVSSYPRVFFGYACKNNSIWLVVTCGRPSNTQVSEGFGQWWSQE